MNTTPVLILASTSPRRRDLLQQIGVTYSVCPVEVREVPFPDEDPAVYVQRMSTAKADAARLVQPPTHLPILAADTEVILDRQILGKPRDYADACAMLAALSGRKHQVISVVTLYAQDRLSQAVSSTEILFNTLAKQEIETYCRTTEPYDKAGGYGIQGLGAVFVRSISGSYSGVVGLPLFETAQLLKQAGVRWGMAK